VFASQTHVDFAILGPMAQAVIGKKRIIETINAPTSTAVILLIGDSLRAIPLIIESIKA
jgi:hypothetical protein